MNITIQDDKELYLKSLRFPENCDTVCKGKQIASLRVQ